MRSGAAHGHRGYFHETALYDSDQAFVDLVAPFVHDGIEAAEPTIVACGEHNAGLLRDAVDCSLAVFVPGADQYAQPGPTIKSFREVFGRLVAEGAQQLRVVGDVPHPGLGTDWTAWRHYEAAVNVAYDDFPIWGLCPYDQRTAPAHVLDDVCCAHPFIATGDGRHEANPRYEAPGTFLERRPDPFDDLGVPALVLASPTASSARRAVGAAAAGALDAAGVERVRLITSELVSNALEYGTAPTRLAVYVDGASVTVAVHDHGAGPPDPLSGWCEPDPLRPEGRGLWIVNQVAIDFRVRRSNGFEVRATVGHRP